MKFCLWLVGYNMIWDSMQDANCAFDLLICSSNWVMTLTCQKAKDSPKGSKSSCKTKNNVQVVIERAVVGVAVITIAAIVGIIIVIGAD